METKEDLLKNIGKKCKINHSSIAGLSNKIGVIKNVHGDSLNGFRYEVHLDKPLYSFTTKLDFYPESFFCEIL